MTTAEEAQLLARFVSAWKRAIEGEVAAMRASSDSFELPLARGEDLGARRYAFDLHDASDKLVAGIDCSVRTSRGEQRATLERCDDLRITLAAEQPIDLGALPITLVVAPWFLYERLVEALDSLRVEGHSVSLALTLFGKRPHGRADTSLRSEHDTLNTSQRAAVKLCSDSELAFVWGPPGTGKTVTLAHVIEELLAQGKRILLASTTNAAIDEALAKMAERPWFAAAAEAGSLIRLGRSEQETFGTELADAARRLQDKGRSTLDQLRARIAQVEQQVRYAESLRGELALAAAPQQSLFPEPPSRLRQAALAGLFSPGLAEQVATRPTKEQAAMLERRLARLRRLHALARERVALRAAALRDLETRLVSEARVVMCTLTNAYLSPYMAAQRFDVLIAEEAGMASLPLLFYAACLSREKTIMVGDPRQLPPIVHSRGDPWSSAPWDGACSR